MDTITPEICEKVTKLCQDFLGGPWVNAKADRIKIQRFMNGFANRNYRTTLTEESEDNNNNCIKVLQDVVVHLYGVEDGAKSVVKFNGEAAEAVILDELSTHGWVPKLHAVFDGGRIDEYVESSNPTFPLLQSHPELIEAIGQQLARIHSIEMPVPKVPNRVQHLLNMISGFQDFKLSDKHQQFQEVYEECLAFPLEEELRWFDSHSPSFGARPVFCQNDMTMNNILVLKKPISEDNKVMIIDFEASGYYYRGFDLSYFLTMRKVEFGVNTETVFHTDDNEDHTRARFLRAYLQEWNLRCKKLDSTLDNLDHLQMEVDYFEMHGQLFSLTLIRKFLMKLDSMPWAKSEMFKTWIHGEKNKYLAQKTEILRKYSHCFKTETP